MTNYFSGTQEKNTRQTACRVSSIGEELVPDFGERAGLDRRMSVRSTVSEAGTVFHLGGVWIVRTDADGAKPGSSRVLTRATPLCPGRNAVHPATCAHFFFFPQNSFAKSESVRFNPTKQGLNPEGGPS